MSDPTEETSEVDSEKLVPAILHISPGDAANVRERTPGTRQPKPEPTNGSSADIGDD